jgi:hypothetical protein
MSIAEIEAAIKTLPKEELSRFDQWYQEFLENEWDKQIAQDVQKGKLDFLLDEVHQGRLNGTLRPLP